MKEHPILFSAPMVLALLADRKFVTRRLSPQWMKVRAGDRLWVRETFSVFCVTDYNRGDILASSASVGIGYRADHKSGNLADGDGGYNFYPVEGDDNIAHAQLIQERRYYEWSPSIHMPRWASRILLEVEEDTRQERLQDITEEDAAMEGLGPRKGRTLFRGLWSTLHTKPGERWGDNPTVYRVGRFRRVL